MISGRVIGIGVVVAAFLALTASNVVLFNWWQSEKESATVAGAALAEATSDAKQCSDAVAGLAAEAATQAASAASAVAEARRTADTLAARAQRQLRAQPSTPGNDCKSASDRFDRWLTERAQ